MSLINDALKKAQHQRTGAPTDLPPMPGGSLGSRPAHQSIPSSGIPPQTLVLIVGSIAAVLAIGVAIMVVFIRREPASHVAPPRSVVAKVQPPPPSPVTASPIIIAPVIAAPPRIEIAAPKAAVTEPVKVLLPEMPKLTAVATAAPAPVSAPSTVIIQELAKPADAPATQDIRILTLLDALRVTGIRSSGKESKVLMNDRVYRINDMIDYTLGIRLTKVETDSLTFTDATGTTYVKNF